VYGAGAVLVRHPHWFPLPYSHDAGWGAGVARRPETTNDIGDWVDKSEVTTAAAMSRGLRKPAYDAAMPEPAPGKSEPPATDQTALYGRIVFGAAAVLFGVIALMWHDSDTWQSLRHIWSLPFGMIIGAGLMIAQIAGGIGMPAKASARLASVILVVVYLLFSLASIPGVMAAPAVYDRYASFFEQFSLLCGAIALLAATEANAARAVALGRLARLGLGVCTVSFTLAQIVDLRVTADLVPKWIPPSQMFWAILTTIAFALAGIAILINRQARLAIRLMTLMLALFGVLVWIPLLIAHPRAHLIWSEFALTFLIAGAAWMVADLKSF